MPDQKDLFEAVLPAARSAEHPAKSTQDGDGGGRLPPGMARWRGELPDALPLGR